jgi:hypothetical protein
MTEDNNDVDLYKELQDELSKSEVEETSGVSAEKPTTEKTVEAEIKDEPELSDDDISKLSPRAQKRIRDLAEQVKVLSEKEISDEPEEKEIIPIDEPHDFKDVQEFLSAVQDEDSRKLLETFAKVLKRENSSVLAPFEAKNNEVKFDTEFSKYEKIEGFSDYKDELKKTYLRNPNQDIDSLFAKTVTNLTLNRIKKVEDKPSNPNRAGKPDLDGLDLAGLYDALDKTRD